MDPDIPCAPALLEGRRVGNINRVGSWSPDSSKFVFSSER
jgi:Tol biopolymer transport system component